MSDVSVRQGRRRSIFTDDVLEMIPLWLDLGADRRDIAEALGTTVGSLEATCSREGISLRASEPGVRRGLGRSRWDRLRQEADARGTSAARLVASLVTKIVDDGLFVAVLDDGDD